jgi:hypothetical protein
VHLLHVSVPPFHFQQGQQNSVKKVRNNSD